MLLDIRDSSVAVFAINHLPRAKAGASIQIDNRRGGELAAQHLLNLGHQRFAFVKCPKRGGEASPTGARPFFTYLEEQGIPPEDREEVSCKLFTFHKALARSCELSAAT
jgi:DNA-binding LacI/PurR family transcriptional regulator